MATAIGSLNVGSVVQCLVELTLLCWTGPLLPPIFAGVFVAEIFADEYFNVRAIPSDPASTRLMERLADCGITRVGPLAGRRFTPQLLALRLHGSVAPSCPGHSRV